jgi:hypothetical protein
MGDQAPSRHLLINQTNGILQFTGSKYVAYRALPHKAYLSRRELAQFLENDMFRAPFIPAEEDHQLAWTLGCVWGVLYNLGQWVKSIMHTRERFNSWFRQMLRLPGGP